MTPRARARALNERPPAAGAYVLYWMQQSQRAACNPALEYAVGEANRLGLPLMVGFGLTAGYPEANRRHYAFMLEGLREVGQTLAARGIGFVVRRGRPDEVALDLAERRGARGLRSRLPPPSEAMAGGGRRGRALPRPAGRRRRRRPGRGGLRPRGERGAHAAAEAAPGLGRLAHPARRAAGRAKAPRASIRGRPCGPGKNPR